MPITGGAAAAAAGDDISARAYHDANQSLSNATWTALAFNSERFDTDGIHDNTTNNSRLTAKTAGKYVIMANTYWTNNSIGKRSLVLRVNGATDIGHHQVLASGQTPVSLATIYELAVNDYVEAWAFQNSGGDLVMLTVNSESPALSMSKILG